MQDFFHCSKTRGHWQGSPAALQAEDCESIEENCFIPRGIVTVCSDFFQQNGGGGSGGLQFISAYDGFTPGEGSGTPVNYVSVDGSSRTYFKTETFIFLCEEAEV